MSLSISPCPLTKRPLCRALFRNRIGDPAWLPDASAYTPPPSIGSKLRSMCASLGMKCISAIGVLL